MSQYNDWDKGYRKYSGLGYITRKEYIRKYDSLTKILFEPPSQSYVLKEMLSDRIENEKDKGQIAMYYMVLGDIEYRDKRYAHALDNYCMYRDLFLESGLADGDNRTPPYAEKKIEQCKKKIEGS